MLFIYYALKVLRDKPSCPRFDELLNESLFSPPVEKLEQDYKVSLKLLLTVQYFTVVLLILINQSNRISLSYVLY